VSVEERLNCLLSKEKDDFNGGMSKLQHNNHTTEGAVWMKIGKSEVHWKTRALPEIRFEDQQRTSFAGLVVFQPSFERLDL
jgi:hypothetical protein